MEIEEIKRFMRELEKSKLHKIIYKKGDFEIHLEKGTSVVSSVNPSLVSSQPVPPQPPEEKEVEGVFVTSPMVGSFYSAGAPDHPPFIKVGDKVNEGTVVCIIEAMKVMNEVKAGVTGTVAEVLFKNGQPVEYGSRLFRVTP